MRTRKRREIVVGCYTSGDYEREAHERLIPSLVSLGLDHAVQEIPSRGSWVLNNSACQLYLQKMDDEHPEDDLLYIDVDGVVWIDPWPFLRTLECDFAAHYFNGTELLSGTVYWPAGPRRREILDCWVERNHKSPDVWDQKNLQAIVDEDPSVRVEWLPAEYCCIFDLQRRLTSKIVPVVEHFQASRRFKKRVVQ